MISASGLYKMYGGRELWGGLSFEVADGEMVGVTGTSGSGKSTLLNALAGIDHVDAGTISVNSYDPQNLRRGAERRYFRDVLGIIFQNFGLVDHWTVSQNLNIAMDSNATKSGARDNQKLYQLERLGLEGLLHTPVFSLSGGEKQRVAAARMFLKPSSVIIADEPSSALDDASVELLMRALEERRNAGTAIVIASHDERVLQLCSNRVEIGQLPVAGDFTDNSAAPFVGADILE